MFALFFCPPDEFDKISENSTDSHIVENGKEGSVKLIGEQLEHKEEEARSELQVRYVMPDVNEVDDENNKNIHEDISTDNNRLTLPSSSSEYINLSSIDGNCIPHFELAENVYDVSDFTVVTFVARLRLFGFNVTKYGRGSFFSTRQRTLRLNPDGISISCIPHHKERRLRLRKGYATERFNLMECLGVRHAWTKDPDSRTKLVQKSGTKNLRHKGRKSSMYRSFSLIFPHRTLDLAASTSDQCFILMQGFSALCFRLQLALFRSPEADKLKSRKLKMSVVTNDTGFSDESTEVSHDRSVYLGIEPARISKERIEI